MNSKNSSHSRNVKNPTDSKAMPKRQTESGSKKADEAIKAYREVATPLGSYSGITSAMSLPGRNFMPETQKVDPPISEGKIYLSENDQPVQDADDL